MSIETIPAIELSLPADLRARGVKPEVLEVLKNALERGEISTREIAYFVTREAERDRELFTLVMVSVNRFLETHNVRLISDEEEITHGAKYPITKQKPAFRKIDDTNDSLIEKLEGSILSESLGSQYKHDWFAKYNAKISQIPLLSPKEEAELGKLILEKQDIHARDKLISHNLRLVRWVVARKFRWSTMAIEDLVQEGNLGLIKAAERYDYRIGRFTTHAIWWVRQAISRAIADKGDTIRLPVHAHELLSKVSKVKREVEARSGETPTLDEIAVLIDMPKDRLERALSSMEISVTSLDKKFQVENAGEGSREEGDSLGDLIPDTNLLKPEMLIEVHEELTVAERNVSNVLQEIMGVLALSDRNKKVFNVFYGLDGKGSRRTLEYVGNQFDITRERIRQIIAKIWNKIDDRGGGMDHRRFLEELSRIEELQKLIQSAEG